MLIVVVMSGVAGAAEPILTAFTQFYLDPEAMPTVVIYADGTVISSDSHWGSLPVPEDYLRPASYYAGTIPAELLQEYMSAIDEALARPGGVEARSGSAHDMRLTIERYGLAPDVVSRGASVLGMSREPVSDPWFLAVWALVDAARRYAEGTLCRRDCSAPSL